LLPCAAMQFSNGSLHVNPVHPQDIGTFICTSTQTKRNRGVARNIQTINVLVIIKVHLTPKCFSTKQSKRIFWSISVQKFFESVKSSIFCAPPKSNSGWLTTVYRRSGSSKVLTSNGERRQGTLSHNSVLRYLSTAFDNENYFSWAP